LVGLALFLARRSGLFVVSPLRGPDCPERPDERLLAEDDISLSPPSSLSVSISFRFGANGPLR
jgi:hypothetical protein